jgi:hypothetical protein
MRFRETLNNGMRLVARAWHPSAGDLMLHAIIATETLLCAKQDTEIKHRFSLLVALITAHDSTNRREAYQRAKALYNYRCGVVHRGQAPNATNPKDQEADTTFAVSVYFASLRHVISWINARVAKGLSLGDSAFEEFHLDSVFPLIPDAK